MECHMISRKRLAIIGTTPIATAHVLAAQQAGFHVTDVAGSNGSQTVNDFAAQHSIPNAWSDPIKLAESNEWDAIIIASAIDSLAELVRCASGQGNAVLVEKPVALDPKLFDDLPLESKNVMVGFNRRYYSAVAQAKQFITQRQACLIQLVVPESVSVDLHGNVDHSRVKTNATHAFDLLNYLTGGLVIANAISAVNGTKKKGVVVNAQTPRGDVCSIVANWNASANFALTIDCDDERFELKPFEVGSYYKGIEVTTSGPSKIRTYSPKLIETYMEKPNTQSLKPGFFGQAEALMELAEGRTPKDAATLKDARAALLLAETLLNA